MRLCLGDLSLLLQNGRDRGCGNGGAGVCGKTVEDGLRFCTSLCVDLLEVGNLYGSRMGYPENILLKTNGEEERQRKLDLVGQGRRGGEGDEETESLILWLTVLELLAVGWWWRGGCLNVCQMCLPCPPSG